MQSERAAACALWGIGGPDWFYLNAVTEFLEQPCMQYQAVWPCQLAKQEALLPKSIDHRQVFLKGSSWGGMIKKVIIPHGACTAVNV